MNANVKLSLSTENAGCHSYLQKCYWGGLGACAAIAGFGIVVVVASVASDSIAIGLAFIGVGIVAGSLISGYTVSVHLSRLRGKVTITNEDIAFDPVQGSRVYFRWVEIQAAHQTKGKTWLCDGKRSMLIYWAAFNGCREEARTLVQEKIRAVSQNRACHLGRWSVVRVLIAVFAIGGGALTAESSAGRSLMIGVLAALALIICGDSRYRQELIRK